MKQAAHYIPIRKAASWILSIGLTAAPVAAIDVPMPTYSTGGPGWLVVRDTGGDRDTVVFRSGKAFAEVAKGAGSDPASIGAQFYFARGQDGDIASFTIPAGSFDGTSGWTSNRTNNATYRNRAAPGGATQCSAIQILPGKRFEVKAKGLGDVPFDIDSSIATNAYTSFCVDNDGERVCHCTEMRDCEVSPSRQGRIFQCRSGVSDEKCVAVTSARRSFTASASLEIEELLAEIADDDIQDIIEQMADLGYGVATGSFDLPSGPGPVPGQHFASVTSFAQGDPFAPTTGSHYFMSHFDDGTTRSRIGGQDAIVSLIGVNSTNGIWSYDVSIAGIVQEPWDPVNPPPVLPRAASSAGSANPLNTQLTPSQQGERAYVIWSGDQQTVEDLRIAFANAEFNEPLLVVPIPDVVIPDGAGGSGSIFSQSELDTPRALFTFGRRWQRRPGRSANDALFAVDEDILKPFYIFYRDEKSPRRPYPVPDISSPTHATLIADVSRDFDRLVAATVDHFEQEEGLRLVSDQPMLATNGTTSHLGVEANLFEGAAKCLADDLYCGLDDPLSLYSWPGDSLILEDDDLYVVLGLNYSRLTGLGGPMAALSVIGAYHVQDPDQPSQNFTPIAEIGIVNDEEDGRDQGIVPVDNILTGNLPRGERRLLPNTFLAQIARPASCLPAPMPSGLCLDTVQNAAGSPMVIAGRLQLNPQTGLRPDPDQVIPWRLLRFKVKP